MSDKNGTLFKSRKNKSRKTKSVKKNLIDCIRDLQRIEALMIAVENAANYDVELDVSDALTPILILIQQLLKALDEVEAST